MDYQLIKLYCDICHYCKYSIVANEMQRLTNNCRPKFTDEEVICVYIWGIQSGIFEVKAIWNFANNYLREYFPFLPGYHAFNKRFVNLASVYASIAELIANKKLPHVEGIANGLLDSMPIIVAKSARSGRAKVASEICNKGYNSSREEYYYGVKVHSIAQKRYETLPIPIGTLVSPASCPDITCAKEWLWNFRNLVIFCDKAYIDSEWSKDLFESQNIKIVTPKKLKKGQSFLDAADELFSSTVSRVRQTIESFFSWLQQMTRIQTASKVRSTKGLLAHIHARLVAAYFMLV